MHSHKVAHPHDIFFRQTFGRCDVMQDLLNAILEQDVLNKLDLTNLKLANKSFVNSLGNKSEGDALFKIGIKGQACTLYALGERQSDIDSSMPFRFLKYDVEIIHQHWMKEGNACLPLIMNVCIYNGKQTYKGAANLLDIFSSSGLDKDLLNQFNFPLINFLLVDLYSTPELALRSWQKASFAAMLLKQGIFRDFKEWLLAHSDLFIEFFKKGYIPYIEEAIKYMWTVDDNPDLVEIISKLDPEINSIAMSVAEKLKLEGEEKGKLEVAENMLKRGYSLEDIIQLTGLSRSQVADLNVTNR